MRKRVDVPLSPVVGRGGEGRRRRKRRRAGVEEGREGEARGGGGEGGGGGAWVQGLVESGVQELVAGEEAG